MQMLTLDEPRAHAAAEQLMSEARASVRRGGEYDVELHTARAWAPQVLSRETLMQAGCLHRL